MPFSGGAATFSQQIPKVICERSCRKAKTLTVKITHKKEKKRGKPKKNKKKWGSDAFSAGKNGKKRYEGTKTDEKPVKNDPAVFVGQEENGGSGILRRKWKGRPPEKIMARESTGQGFTHIT